MTKTWESMTQEKRQQAVDAVTVKSNLPARATFVSYMLEFYGVGGIYDMGMTPDEVLEGTIEVIREHGYDVFEGDSLDRERVRDMVLAIREARVQVVRVRADEYCGHVYQSTDDSGGYQCILCGHEELRKELEL